MKNILILTILLLASVLNTNGQTPIAPGVNTNIPISTLKKTVNDITIKNLLLKMSNGEFYENDSYLLDLMKKEIQEAVLLSGEYTNPKAFLQAGTKKAQILVSELTAAYTRAIFKSKSAIEARKILGRYQNTIRMIVDFTKDEKYGL